MLAAGAEGMENGCRGPAWMAPAPRSSSTWCAVADGYQDSCRGRADLRSQGFVQAHVMQRV